MFESIVHRTASYYAGMSGLRTHDVPTEVDPDDWALCVTGTVDRSLRLTPDDLASFPLETAAEDFACVEGWVAKGLSWRGVRVESVLERAEPTENSEYGLVSAMDGDYACSFPIDRLSSSILALELDGEALPVDHGGPVRLVPTKTAGRVSSGCRRYGSPKRRFRKATPQKS